MARGKFVDLTGMVFERLTVVGRDKERKPKVYWWCTCSCNNEMVKRSIITSSLTGCYTQSCGCLQKEKVRKTMSKTMKKYNTYDLSGEYGIGYTNKGEEFHFDLEDYDKIKNYCWHKNKYGYFMTRDGNKKLLIHRLIMDVTDSTIEVDHIKHKLYDNRKDKLRISFTNENQINRKLMKNNTSGVTGVFWNKQDNLWSTQLTIDGKRMYVGSSKNFEIAVKNRKEAEEKYFGELSYDNSINSSTAINQE